MVAHCQWPSTAEGPRRNSDMNAPSLHRDSDGAYGAVPGFVIEATLSRQTTDTISQSLLAESSVTVDPLEYCVAVL